MAQSASALSSGSTPQLATVNEAASLYAVASSQTITEAVSAIRSLGTSASVTQVGVANTPAPAATTATAAAGTVYYVDSQRGNDAHSGLAPVASGGTTGGPWKTLARLSRARLAAGDTVILACDSTWSETLRIVGVGTALRPITVKAPSKCTTPPTIDGSLRLAPSAWTLVRGSIYRATLESSPTQLFGSAGYFTEAHHPNVGFSAADPKSRYAAIAANGNTVSNGNASGSTLLAIGNDLVLPAGAAVTAGTRVRVRTNSWTLDESMITAAQANRLSLSKATSAPLVAGWGYFLLGQSWMVDSPGEWHYNPSSKELIAWMHSATQPTAALFASVLPIGIDINNRNYVTIDGLTVRRVGTGIQLRNSVGAVVRNSTFEDTSEMGADAAASTSPTLESNTFTRVGTDAISGRDDDSAPATRMTIRDNVIRNSGVIMEGDAVVSLPKMSRAAIRAGEVSLVKGNTIVDSGYIGIRLMGDSTAEDNYIYGACSVLDDCGGIYLSTYRNSIIQRNTVVHSRGSVLGKPTNKRQSQGQGIYLDEGTSSNLVENNTVVDADHGIQIHISATNTLRANRLYGNRISQLWMQDSAASKGAVNGNLVEYNQLAAVYPGSVAMLFETDMGSTSGFATFNGNRYYDRVSSVIAKEVTSSGVRAMTFSEWQRSQGIGSRQSVDAAGSYVSGKGYAAYTINGTNLISNSQLLQNAAGWSTWNSTAPMGQMYREGCTPGICLRYAGGGSPGIVSSPNFSVRAGQWYRLTVDLATSADAQPVQLLVRRGGGAANGYESLSDRSLTMTANRNWNRYSVIFQATQTVNAADLRTGDKGARVDIEQIASGSAVSLANMELVPILVDTMMQSSSALVNGGTSASSVQCPLPTSQLSYCVRFNNLADDQPVVWPVSLPARGGAIVYMQQPNLADTDGDGIPDSQDRCANTQLGAAVNSSGCSLNQRTPLQ